MLLLVVALLLLEMLAQWLGPSRNSNAASYVLLYFLQGIHDNYLILLWVVKTSGILFIPVDEDTDVQRGQSVSSRPQASWRQSQD